MKQKKFLLLLLAFVIFLAAAAALYSRLAANQVPQNAAGLAAEQDSGGQQAATGQQVDGQTSQNETPQQAADFTVWDLAGNETALSDLLGKPVIVNFWATWCSVCTAELPNFEDAYAAYGDQAAFVMVNLTDGSQETEADVQEFIAAEEYRFPVYLDHGLNAAATYRIYGIPTTLFIDSDGFLVERCSGPIEAAALEEKITALLGENGQ